MRPSRSRMRDFWQLDVPLVIVLILCTSITVIEAMRATEGVWRAWIYLFEWPMIGAFAVWIWYRFKHEEGGGFVRRWRERVARMEAEAEQEAQDPELAAWRTYQRRLREREAEQHPDAG